MRNFKVTFLDNLRLALAVYRYARVEVNDRGVDLYPSRPPVNPKTVAVRASCAAGKVPTLAIPPADRCRSPAPSTRRRAPALCGARKSA
jgi:hypothetical protein